MIVRRSFERPTDEGASGIKGYRRQGRGIGSARSLQAERTADALLDTEGLQTPVDPVAAQGTLLRVSLCGIETDGIVRTGLGAGPAAGASLTVDQHNPVRTFMNCPGRTDLPAGRIRAVPAGVGPPGESKPRVCSGGTPRHCTAAGNHPDPRARLQTVLRLSGDDAGAATDAPAFIPYQVVLPIFHLPYRTGR